MSDEKKSGLGLFINKKSGSTPKSSPPLAGGKPKDVKKRWLYVGVGLVGVIVVTSTLFSTQDEKRPVSRKKSDDATINVVPPNADKAAFESRFSRDQERVQGEVVELRAQLERQAKVIEDMKAGKGTGARVPESLPEGIVPPPSHDKSDNTGGLGALGGMTPPPAPPLPPTPTRTPSVPSAGPTLTAVPGAPIPGDNSGAAMVFEAPGEDSGGSGANGEGGVTARTTYKKNTNAGMLPAGAFATVALLNGLDAGTSAATQSNPMPVLMNVANHATLPGAAKYRLKNCFVLGTGYGDLSAERVYIRFSRLSCVDKKDKLVLSQEVAGYVVDSDGKLGMRGLVTDRQGAKLGKSLLAGFAQGLASALGQAQGVYAGEITGTGTTSINGVTTTGSAALNGSSALRASGLGGAQVAASQLAEFYLKEAQSIFPVISIDAGRTGTIVFSASASLNWADSENQYVKSVTPVN